MKHQSWHVSVRRFVSLLFLLLELPTVEARDFPRYDVPPRPGASMFFPEQIDISRVLSRSVSRQMGTNTVYQQVDGKHISLSAGDFQRRIFPVRAEFYCL